MAAREHQESVIRSVFCNSICYIPVTADLQAWGSERLAADKSSGFRTQRNLKGRQKMRFSVKDILKKYARDLTLYCHKYKKNCKRIRKNRYGLIWAVNYFRWSSTCRVYSYMLFLDYHNSCMLADITEWQYCTFFYFFQILISSFTNYWIIYKIENVHSTTERSDPDLKYSFSLTLALWRLKWSRGERTIIRWWMILR